MGKRKKKGNLQTEKEIWEIQRQMKTQKDSKSFQL